MAYLGNLGCSTFGGSSSSTSEQLNLKQNLIKLNENEIGSGVDEKVAGLLIERGQLPDAILQFNEDRSVPTWEIGLEGSLAPVHLTHRFITNSASLESFTVNHVDATNQSVVLLLPNNPTNGASITILDSKGMFDIHPVTLSSSYHFILESHETMLLNTKYGNVTLTFMENKGWSVSPHVPIELFNIDYDNFTLTDEQIADIIPRINTNDFTTDQIDSITVNLDTSKLTPRQIDYIVSKIDASTFSPQQITQIASRIEYNNTLSETQIIELKEALDLSNFINVSTKGTPNGVASLDASGRVPTNQLPSFVDDVLEFNNFASLPTTGETGKIYVDKSTNTVYRWSGSSYIKISQHAETANKLTTARSISLTGDVTGSATFDGSSNITITATVANNNHNPSLESLSNTTISNNTAGELLKWDGSKWVNNTLAEAGIASASHNHVISNIDGLQSALNSKSASNHNHNGVYLGINANAVSASKLATARSISLTGDVTGSANFDGSSNVTITATVADDSHNHVISNIDGLQSALNGKSPSNHNHDSAYLKINLRGAANGVASLDSSGKVPANQLNIVESIESKFDRLNISSVSYTNEMNVNSVYYTSGNKKVFTYDSDSNIKTIKYYDTNGTSLLATQTMNYNSNGYLVSASWS